MKRLTLVILFLTGVFTGFYPRQKSGFQPPFNEGETLTYLLYYGLLNGGRGTLEVNRTELEGRPVYHARAVARTIGLADKIYRVEDIYESFMDEATGMPLKAIRNIREGKYRYYNEVVYLRDSSMVFSQRSGYVKTPKGIIDMVSALYHLRKIDRSGIHVGDTIRMVTYFADEIYPLIIRYRGKEVLKTKLGTFNCEVFAPVTEPGRVFKTEDDMLMWFSDDANFIPLRIQFNMWIGSMKVDLVEHTGLKYPVLSQLK